MPYKDLQKRKEYHREYYLKVGKAKHYGKFWRQNNSTKAKENDRIYYQEKENQHRREF